MLRVECLEFYDAGARHVRHVARVCCSLRDRFAIHAVAGPRH